MDLLTNDDQPGRLVEEQLRWALDYIVTTYDEANLKKRRESLRDKLKDWIIENCDQDENGNYIYYFPKPIIMDDKEVRGLMAQRRVSQLINEDTAFEVAIKYNVTDQVVEKIVTEELNMDTMYVLNQQGVIPDEDIDSILELKETYALFRID